jgi:hypothetical protein
LLSLSKGGNMQTTYREKRLAKRSRVFFGGEILIDSDIPSVECHVKNISASGANIVVLSGNLLPSEFDLVIRKTGERQRAVVTWNCGRQIGIAFRRPSTPRKSLSPRALRQSLRFELAKACC